jgi:hypothetical protein
MFSACYYLSYRNALKDFNESAVERNQELIASLEKNGLLYLNTNENTEDTNTNSEVLDHYETAENNTTNELIEDTSLAVDTVNEDTIVPNTEYILQTYDIKTGAMKEETLPIPSYLVGLSRNEVIEYLYVYMQDLPWSEFEKGLLSFELMNFSEDNVILRKTYNIDMVEYKYFLKTQNGTIVVYYGDQKTVFEYTGVSVEGLTQFEKQQLDEGIFVKDINEVYALLENYSS